jgi:mannose-1-phosphate guanylyltransferase/phosphomannomutase
MATRLGVAYGAKLGRGKYVITSRDASQTSRMIKRSIIAGLISMGVRVGDLRTIPIPAARYEIGKEGESGGIHVRISPFDSRVADILFFDETGCDIQPSLQKSIEQAFFKEDFPRANVNEVGEIILPPRATQYYKEGVINSLDVSSVKERPVKIVCDYAFSPASLVLPEILGSLNVEVISLNGVLNPFKTSKTLDEFNSSLDMVSKVVRSTKADFGVMLDVGGEKIFLVDSKGRRIHSQKALIVILELVGRTFSGGKVALPVNASSIAIEVAKKFKLDVVPTGTTPQSIMRTCKEKKVIFAGDGKGGFIFPSFQPSFDGMYALCKIIEMCAKLGVNLTDIASKIDDPKIVKKQIYCPWEKKGFLMRKLIEEIPSGKRQLVDGVKLIEKRKWILFIPDTTSAKFNIYCEAPSRKDTNRMITCHTKKIRDWLKAS